MKFFSGKKKSKTENNSAVLAEMALNTILDGVIITDKAGVVEFINPAAITLTGCGSVENALGLDYGLLLKFESKEGRELSDEENPLILAMQKGQALEKYEGTLIGQDAEKRVPIAISMLPAGLSGTERIITFRDITKDLEEEGAMMEFISTASHEMRTPVASIEGYLSLAINPQTATIDERAKKYLTAAHMASQHLGRLFRDLLDTTKFEDGRVRPQFEPVELVGTVKQMADSFLPQATEAKLKFQFGAKNGGVLGVHKINQVVYGFVDVGFLREILGNLIDNAIKYTPEGGSIYVNVLGDGDRALINVTDTGIGVSADDLQHIFQKFYRSDNSQTRTVGGTGLGLYLVKQRVEAMGGKVWAESAFGEGSTFYVSLPRITGDEYEKRMISYQNQQAAQAAKQLAEAKAQTPVVQTSVAQTPVAQAQVAQPIPSVELNPPASQTPTTPQTPVTSQTPTTSQTPATSQTPTTPQMPTTLQTTAVPQAATPSPAPPMNAPQSVAPSQPNTKGNQ